MKHSSIKRRGLLVLGAGILMGCQGRNQMAMASQPTVSAEDEALKRKFRGLEGGQLRVDSLFRVIGLNIFDESGGLFFRAASIRPGHSATLSYGADFGVPKFLRVGWRDKIEMESRGAIKRGLPADAFYGGTVLGDYTVPVASRIPEALLEERRRNGGGFRLKIRIHPEGPLIGWDLARGMASAPDGSRYHFARGDFQEAFIHQGKVLRKGWYIHPKTGEKFETDF